MTAQDLQHAIQAAARALEAGQLDEASRMAQQVLAAAPGEPNACQIMGLVHMREGRAGEALKFIRKALKVAPTNPQILNMLGSALRTTGDVAGARKAFAKSIAANRGATNKSYVEPQINLANLDLGEGAREAARTGFEAVLTAQPGNGLALSGLARLAMLKNNPAEAHELAAKALEALPGNILSLLIKAEASVRLKNYEEALGEAKVLAARPDIEPTNNALALGFAAEAADKLARYDEAFALFTQANAQVAALNAAVMAEPPTPYHPAVVAQVQAYLAAHPDDTAPQVSDESAPPVFLVGFPRSGTTLLEQILLAHPKVTSLEEEQTFDRACRDLILAPDGLERLANLSEKEALRYRKTYWRDVKKLGAQIPEGGLLVDKQPLDTILLPLIAKIFPDAKILFALRDPRDVVLSCFQQRFDINQAMFQFLDLQTAASYYDQVMTLGRAARLIYPLHLHEVRYDAIVADLEAEARAVIKFLGLEWTDDVLEYRSQITQRAINTPSVSQVVQPIYTSATGKWRNYDNHMAPVRHLLDPWAEQFGYEVG